MTDPPTDRLAVRPAEAARLIGVSERHIYNALQSGGLRSHRFKRTRLILIDDLRAWVQGLEG